MIFLDIETYDMGNTSGLWDLKTFKISYIGIIDSETKEETDIWEKDMDQLRKILFSGKIIAGYNIFSFDMPVIANYLGPEVNNLPMFDEMVAAWKKIGFRPKLNNLSNATLGRGKLGTGLDAGIYYANKEFDKLKRYCMEDTRLTLEVYEYGLKNGSIKYYDKNGFARSTEIDWTLGYKNVDKKEKKEETGSENLTLF